MSRYGLARSIRARSWKLVVVDEMLRLVAYFCAGRIVLVMLQNTRQFKR